MNIEILQEHVNTFSREVIDTGFKRDLDDYITSLPAAQNNIMALRDVAGKVLSALDHLYTGDLPEALCVLLPKDNIRPFTEVTHNEKLRSLIENTDIQQQEFFSQLTQLLNQLKKQLDKNITEIDNISQFISPYIAEDVKHIAKDQFAIIAIVFNEHNTITSLKQFTKALSAWNRTLPIYHQLLKSESPKDIQIVEIQNGSIDFVVNMNVDVALDLVELFKVGFKVFVAYLSYKKMIKPIIDSYHGNEKLISQEEEREKLLLENIGTAIHKQIESQHKKAKKVDKDVDGTAVLKKIEQVTNLITAHIVKGNDLKLLALPKTEQTEEEEIKLLEEKNTLREQSIAARRQLRQINPEAMQKLIETYGQLKDEVE
jgi:ferritin-like protein